MNNERRLVPLNEIPEERVGWVWPSPILVDADGLDELRRACGAISAVVEESGGRLRVNLRRRLATGHDVDWVQRLDLPGRRRITIEDLDEKYAALKYPIGRLAADETDPTPPPEVLAEIKAVVAKAKAGDAGAVPRLRQFLARYPALWRRYGDVAAQAEMAWITLAAGPDLYLKECLVRFARDQRAALTRPAAPPVERLLVDRAVACWLQLQYFTAIEANALSADEPPRLLQFRARRQAQAQRMYESALAALVAVQRLLPAAPARDESAAAAAGGRGEEGFAADAAVDLPNRVESFFGRPPGGRRTTGPVPAGASN